MELETTKEALPTGSKRGGGVARNSVDYWLAKKELPPRDGTDATTKLRREVAKARAAQDENTGKFTSQPFVGT